VTKRSLLKIFEKIRYKIEDELMRNIGGEWQEDIENALHDKYIENQIKSLMKQDRIHLHNE
jgi:hypothetical protein